MAPFLEMLLEGTSAPVAVIPADLALEFLIEAVQFVEPVWNGLAIPTCTTPAQEISTRVWDMTEGELEGIVDVLILFFTFFLLNDLLLLLQ